MNTSMVFPIYWISSKRTDENNINDMIYGAQKNCAMQQTPVCTGGSIVLVSCRWHQNILLTSIATYACIHYRQFLYFCSNRSNGTCTRFQKNEIKLRTMLLANMHSGIFSRWRWGSSTWLNIININTSHEFCFSPQFHFAFGYEFRRSEWVLHMQFLYQNL